MGWRILSLLLLAFGYTNSEYLLTTPKKWTEGTESQICVVLTSGAFVEADSIKYSLTETRLNGTLTQDEIKFPLGESSHCANVAVPKTQDSTVTLDLTGTVGGEVVQEVMNVSFVNSRSKTFIQTDKYLYRQGQTVQFRILTLKGQDAQIVTEGYDEIYVENPSRTRIAQWLNVSNPSGLVHLNFDLHDEADEGTYTIHISSPTGSGQQKSFKVEEFVLPKFEVTLKSPNVILGSDKEVTIEMCATYTFGEPVKGNSSIHLAAGNWRVYANLSDVADINGCRQATFPTDKLYFDHNNCHIRITNLKARGVVSESGTDVEIFGANDKLTVHRTAIQFQDISPKGLKKPYLPVDVDIKGVYADGKNAANEPMSMCTFFLGERVCKNVTSDAEGLISFVMPSNSQERVEITALNYPKIEKFWNDVMRESKYNHYNRYSDSYQDATNSSLSIYYDKKIQCTSGQDVSFTIPLIYISNENRGVDLHIQIMSNGQIVHQETKKVALSGSKLPFEDKLQLIPIDDLPAGYVRGSIDLPFTLPPSVSPQVKLLVWYSTAEGVVVDSKELNVEDCLTTNVEFKFSADKVEPGQQANLILKGPNDGLCSVGVVDKSVELLGGSQPLTVKDIINLGRDSAVSRYDHGQLTHEYCHRKYNYTDFGTNETLIRESGKRFHDFPGYDRVKDSFETLVEAGYFISTNMGIDRRFCEALFISELKIKYQEDLFEDPVNRLVPQTIAASPHRKTTTFNAPRPAIVGSAFQGGNDVELGLSIETTPEGLIRDQDVKERSYLPETWLWMLQPLSSTGDANEVLTLPDSITEWVGRAICVHPTQGVGLSEKASITTFTPFFVDLTLPPSVTRGEVLPIKISTFNYLNEDLPVKVSVEASEDYAFAEGETGVREICVPAKSNEVVTIKVDLVTIGDTNLTINAESAPLSSGSCGSGSFPIKKDRLIKSLPVEAEGYIREKSFSKYICSEDIANSAGPLDTWQLQSPDTFVEGSERAWINAIGDLMGATIENLGHLVRLPSGCGEQNMVNFAPNIYIMEYLELTDQNTEELKSKLTRFLNHGYQRQLKFRHPEHAYSAFGTNDQDPSTWLTAFVVKSFAQARPYTVIDENSLKKSANWLKTLQDKDGCFQSKGRLIHKTLQGGLKTSNNSSPLLTAYVLTALLAEGNMTQEEIDLTTNCILTDTSAHPYSLALKAYALALAKHPSAKGLVDQLVSVAAANDTVLRWNLPDREGHNSALHVETAAYAILGMVQVAPSEYKSELRKVVRWLFGMRNGRGGFVSTQDTVVALQALSAFEGVQPRQDLKMEINVDSTVLGHSFAVDNTNKFLQQRIDVPTLPATVDVTATGTGCAVVEGVLRYNVLADSTGEAFTLSVITQPDAEKCKTQKITACATYTLEDGASNMAIFEVKLVSGYIPIKSDLKNVIANGGPNFKRYEVNGPKVFFYLDEINAEEVCVSFRAYPDVEIENAKPGTVSVYDYYQPEYIKTQKYTFTPATC